MQPLYNVNHVITCNNNTSTGTCTGKGQFWLMKMALTEFTLWKCNNQCALNDATLWKSFFFALYFDKLACFRQFWKHALFGSPFCWWGSPFGPHFTKNWVPILTNFGLDGIMACGHSAFTYLLKQKLKFCSSLTHIFDKIKCPSFSKISLSEEFSALDLCFQKWICENLDIIFDNLDIIFEN